MRVGDIQDFTLQIVCHFCLKIMKYINETGSCLSGRLALTTATSVSARAGSEQRETIVGQISKHQLLIKTFSPLTCRIPLGNKIKMSINPYLGN